MTALLAFVAGLLLGVLGFSVALGAMFVAVPEVWLGLIAFCASLGADDHQDEEQDRRCGLPAGVTACPQPWGSQVSCVGCPHHMPRGWRRG